jgi:hypothetical protein
MITIFLGKSRFFFTQAGFAAVLACISQVKLDQLKHQQEKMKQVEFVYPILALSYLSMTIVLTDLSSFLKDSIKLRVKLNDIWETMRHFSHLGIFTWKHWARLTMGVIEEK